MKLDRFLERFLLGESHSDHFYSINDLFIYLLISIFIFLSRSYVLPAEFDFELLSL